MALPAGETAGTDGGEGESVEAEPGRAGVQNTAAQLTGRVVGIFLSAGTSILLPRFLGKEKLGEYGAIYAYLSLYGFFATFCLAREVSVRRHQAAGHSGMR